MACYYYVWFSIPLNIRIEKVTFHERYWFNISSEAKDFIQSLLQINPEKRLNVIEAIEHPW
ncbi:hypothetical protein PFMALIP_01765 [Plasmodium falciparum MaliPS096_E11]|uniref:Protein kinase domain-containing protein n=1 Tax=Plasmodium falciparum MaliPS096_E11 TaxID=1036727 RepID=A0A024WTA2_PLAFA|nr:hypothetical protein PFMALIP_01765 [Plasmodium falciparum MaliPS096_E11]